jgi:hypothetical protein
VDRCLQPEEISVGMQDTETQIKKKVRNALETAVEDIQNELVAVMQKRGHVLREINEESKVSEELLYQHQESIEESVMAWAEDEVLLTQCEKKVATEWAALGKREDELLT